MTLHMLLAMLLSGMRNSIQAELVRHVSERAFCSACTKLGATAISALNAWLVRQAYASGCVPRWQGIRLDAADATALSSATAPVPPIRGRATNRIRT